MSQSHRFILYFILTALSKTLHFVLLEEKKILNHNVFALLHLGTTDLTFHSLTTISFHLLKHSLFCHLWSRASALGTAVSGRGDPAGLQMSAQFSCATQVRV